MKLIRVLVWFVFLVGCNVLTAKPFDVRDIQEKEVDKLIDKKRDEEILKILDALDKQLDILELEPSKNEVLKGNVKPPKEPIELLDEALLLEDNLDDLELEQTLEAELKMLESIPQDQTILGTEPKDKVIPESGVGIKGGEEFLINKLDHSSLMNIDKELEKLNKKINVKPPEKEKLDDFE